MYCDKHNRDMLPSKFVDKRTGEKGYWCPDCYKEWKDKQPQTPQRVDSNAVLMDKIGAINERLDKLIAFLVLKLGK